MKETTRIADQWRPGASSGDVQLHGAVQHHLWHAGQMSALKRAQGLPVTKPAG